MSAHDPYDPEPHQRRHNEASARLLVALDPQTEAERKLVVWLTNWDTSTLNTIAAMVERRVG